MTGSLIAPLFEGPLDVVGDVHGEIDALRTLLGHLGYDAEGRHPQGRRLAFIGDLADRGPDSVAVVDWVRVACERGLAQCVAGNHELNALRNDPKHGNGWFFGREERVSKEGPNYPSLLATPEARERVRGFFGGLPLGLEREDLRLIHACWHDESVAEIRGRAGSLLDVDRHFEQRQREVLAKLGTAYGKALTEHRLTLHVRDRDGDHPWVADIARYDVAKQMSNPVNVVASGVEQIPANRSTFFSSGKWRMIRRVPWWEDYEGTPVLVGHYWRRRVPKDVDPEKRGSDMFGATAPDVWLGKGRVFCVDYSVGRRYDERLRYPQRRAFKGMLAALRVPEWTLHFDDGATLPVGPPAA